MKEIKKPHVGNVIKAKLKEQGRTVTWLAKQLSFTRENLYNIFNKEYISTNLLLRISEILGYDFFNDFSQYLNKKK